MTSASTYSEPTIPVLEANQDILSLPKRPFPEIPKSAILHGHPLPVTQVTVLNSQSALEQIRTHSISNLRSELGGALLGHAYRKDEQLFVEVKAAVPAQNSDHGPVHFTFNADAWVQIQRDRDQHYPDLDIVGWFHTHPGLNVFYSSDDVVVHSAAFTLPWHVGLVVDPIRNEACYFGWEKGVLTPFTGFYELTDVQEKSVIPWKVVKTAVWHQSETEIFYGLHEARGDNPSLYYSDRYLGNLIPNKMQFMLAAGVVGLILGFFLLVGWAIPLSRQLSNIESVVLTSLNETSPNVESCIDPRVRILTPLTNSRAFVGSKIDLLGTVEHPNATRYTVTARAFGAEDWQDINSRRTDITLGSLGAWNTTGWTPGVYQLRLTAVDRNNIPLSDSASCIINFELLP